MKKWPWFLLAIFLIVLDQWTKHVALDMLIPYQPVNVLPVLNWTLAFNTGAAFSFLGNTGAWHTWLFVGINSIVSIFLIRWIIQTPPTARMQLAGAALILSGALGNLIDRLHFGHVIDFIQVFYEPYYWPIFNLADTVICIGAFLLIVDLVVCRQVCKEG